MQAEKQKRVEIAKALAVASFVITGNEINAIAMDAMVEDLAPYGVETVMAALARCRRECKGRMSLADIIERMESSDGRPGADEAWMNALLAADEYTTVVWTEEAEQAFSIARPAIEINDKTGARMAFRSAYERLVNASREQNKPVKWSVSLGFDVEQRRNVLEKAVQCGLLTANHAIGLLLPTDSAVKTTDDMIMKLACVNGEIVNDEAIQRETTRRRIAELKSILEKKKA